MCVCFSFIQRIRETTQYNKNFTLSASGRPTSHFDPKKQMSFIDSRIEERTVRKYGEEELRTCV
jgi:hypothetical protein